MRLSPKDFVTKFVVCEGYLVKDGYIHGTGKIVRVYNPYEAEDLLTEFINLERQERDGVLLFDEQQVKDFAKKYGLLGSPIQAEVEGQWNLYKLLATIEETKALNDKVWALIEGSDALRFGLLRQELVEEVLDRWKEAVTGEDGKSYLQIDFSPTRVKSMVKVSDYFAMQDPMKERLDLLCKSGYLSLFVDASWIKNDDIYLYYSEETSQYFEMAEVFRKNIRVGNVDFFHSLFCENTYWLMDKENRKLTIETRSLYAPLAWFCLLQAAKGLLELRVCSLCGRYYCPSKTTQRYCSSTCQTRARLRRQYERQKKQRQQDKTNTGY